MIFVPFEEILRETQIIDNLIQFSSQESNSFSKIYREKSIIITIIIFIYIFLSIVVITKITKIYKGPLRSK